jgi:uncharacterized protein (TIGR02646 family)
VERKRSEKTLDTTLTWREHRPAMNDNGVLESLLAMVGKRRRCMWCGDSKATDIEHHWPKKKYPERMFRWDNLLLLCWPCNKHKGQKFPLDGDGLPLLVDPTIDDPWDHLVFVHETGMVVARPDPDTGQEDPRGAVTTDPENSRLNDEEVTESRSRSFRLLKRTIERFLEAEQRGARIAVDDVIAELGDIERPELIVWFFDRDGRYDEPFRRIVEGHAELTARILATVDATKAAVPSGA